MEKSEPDLQKNLWTFLGLVSFHKVETAMTGIFLGIGNMSCCYVIEATVVEVFLFFLTHESTNSPFISSYDDDDELCLSSLISIACVICVELWDDLDNFYPILMSSWVDDVELCVLSCILTKVVTWRINLCNVVSWCALQQVRIEQWKEECRSSIKILFKLDSSYTRLYRSPSFRRDSEYWMEAISAGFLKLTISASDSAIMSSAAYVFNK